VGNPQFFSEERKTILLQPGKVVEKHRLNAVLPHFANPAWIMIRPSR
jgi:hypothetical protein